MTEDPRQIKSDAGALITTLEGKFKRYNDLLVNQSKLSEDFNRGFGRIGEWIKNQRNATSELIDQIKHIEKQINEIIKTVGFISEEASTLSDLITAVIGSIEDGRKSIKNKEELLKAITETASEVDILARNAEIKSYHAGEEGRGFGVVAREMAQLALDVEIPVKMINDCAREIVTRFSTIEEKVERINKFRDIANGLSTTLKKISNDGIILLPFLRKSLAHVDKCLTDLNELTGNLEQSAREIETWSNQAIDTWERNSIIINQFVGVANRLKDMINPVFKERLSKILKLYPLNRLSIYRGVQLDEHEILALLGEISRIQNDQTTALTELKEKVSDWRDFLKELSRQFIISRTEYQDLINFSFGIGNINQKIRELNELITELDLIFEKARLLSLYARIEAVRPKTGSGLLPVSEGMKKLSDKVSQGSLRLKQEIKNLFNFSKSLAENFDSTNYQIKRLVADSEESIGFFTGATRQIDNLAQTVIKAEAELNKIDLSKSIGIGENLADNFNQLKELKVEDDIEDVVEFTRGLSQTCREWPSVITKEETLRIGMVGRPLILDPGHRTDANSHRVNIMIFAGLYQIDQRNNILPSIATSAELSPDGKIWTFHLQQGVHFHDGKEVKAKDVVYTLKHILKGPNRSFIEMVAGAKEYQTGTKNIISGITVIDDYTVQVRLDYPFLPFLATLACGSCDLIHDGFNPSHPVGVGPYRFVDWTGHIIRLTAHEDFFEGRPLIRNIEIHLLPTIKDSIELYKQGKLDIIPMASGFTHLLPEDEIHTGPLLTIRYIGINMRAETPLRDKRLRMAINMAIDRERFVTECLGGLGVPAMGIFPPSLSVYDPEIRRSNYYDPDQARRLVAEVGLDQTFDLDVYNTETAVMLAEWLSRELLKIGIRIEIKPRDNLLEWTYRGKSIMAVKGWLSDNGDPDNFLFPIFHSSSWGRTGNTSFYSNKEVDQMIEQARTVRNRIRRDAIYRTIEKKIIEDLPVIPLAHNFSGHAVKPKVKGFIPDPFDVIKPANLWIS